MTIFQTPDLAGYLKLSKGRTFEKELIYEGRFNDGEQEFKISEEDLKVWKNSFKKRSAKGLEVPVVANHSFDPRDRLGTLVSLSVRKDSKGRWGLFGVLEFVDAEAAKVARQSDVSIYSPSSQVAAGKTWEWPLVHVGVTDYPVVNDMDNFSLVASLVEKISMPEKEQETRSVLELSKENDELQEEIKALKLQLIEVKLFASMEEAEEKEEEEEEDTEAKDEKEVKNAEEEEDEDEDEDEDKKKKKKVMPFQISAAQINLLRDNRSQKLERLLDKGKASPAVIKKLEAVFCSQANLALSFSNQSNTEEMFAFMLSILEENETISLEEKTGAQTIRLSTDMSSKNYNPLLADMESRK